MQCGPVGFSYDYIEQNIGNIKSGQVGVFKSPHTCLKRLASKLLK